jgi:hypothetical protein
MNIEEQMMGSNPYTDVPWSFPKHLEAFTGGEVTDVYRGRIDSGDDQLEFVLGPHVL